jgi:hypothetical protein
LNDAIRLDDPGIEMTSAQNPFLTEKSGCQHDDHPLKIILGLRHMVLDEREPRKKNADGPFGSIDGFLFWHYNIIEASLSFLYQTFSDRAYPPYASQNGSAATIA